MELHSKRLMLGLMVATGLGAYYLTERNNSVIKTPIQPTPTNDSVQLDPDYEMCILPTLEPDSMTGNDAVNAYIAGTPVPPDILIRGDASSLENMTITPSEIIANENNNISNYQVTLIPVGYSNEAIPKRMEQLANDLSLIFHGVNVDFSYLNKSVPIQINHIDRLLRFENQEDANKMYAKINDVYTADSIVFVINSDMYGGSGGRTAIATGEDTANLFTIAHELAHGIYQRDGYQRFYKTDASKSIQNNEMFYDPNKLGETDPIVNQAYKNLGGQPPSVIVGKCNGTPVSSFYGVKNIMNSYWTNKDLKFLIQEGGSPFTSFQIQTMNEYIKTITEAY